MTDNHYSVGFLWKGNKPVLPFNRDLAFYASKIFRKKKSKTTLNFIKLGKTS